MRTILIALLMTLATQAGAAPISAQDFEKGVAAFNSGDYATAFKEFKSLADAGGKTSQYNLGVMYENGQGVRQDYVEAARWYTLAAEQGYGAAQYKLGVMYANGQGVLQDYNEAVKWYTLAAEQGVAKAQLNLGAMYFNGKGVLADVVIAHMWFNITAANGDETGSEYRETLATLMTPEDISKAQAMARVCMSSNYEKCGY